MKVPLQAEMQHAAIKELEKTCGRLCVDAYKEFNHMVLRMCFVFILMGPVQQHVPCLGSSMESTWMPLGADGSLLTPCAEAVFPLIRDALLMIRWLSLSSGTSLLR